MTVYLPDDLAAEMKAELPGTNVSQVCQAALRAELNRARARAAIAAEGFERIEVYDSEIHGSDVAFQGRRIAFDRDTDQEAWLTSRGAIAIYSGREQQLYTYANYAEFDAVPGRWPSGFKADIAHALGEKYIRELDI